MQLLRNEESLPSRQSRGLEGKERDKGPGDQCVRLTLLATDDLALHLHLATVLIEQAYPCFFITIQLLNIMVLYN